MDGWIKLHRKILENPIVCKDSDYLAVWVYLLLNATHKEQPVVFGGKKIILKPGELITGRHSIASQLSISESKVKRILIAFESDQQIARLRSNKNSVITILNWDKYQLDDQQNDQQMTSNRPASDQQVTTNKNERMKEVYNNPPISPQKGKKEKFAEFVSMTTAEYQKLVDQYGEEMTREMITVLDNYKGSNGKRYKSDYRAILNWVADRVTQKHQMRMRFEPKAPELPLVTVSPEEEAFLQSVYRQRAEASESARRTARSLPS